VHIHARYKNAVTGFVRLNINGMEFDLSGRKTWQHKVAGVYTKNYQE
jgi:hypothetical protein